MVHHTQLLLIRDCPSFDLWVYCWIALRTISAPIISGLFSSIFRYGYIWHFQSQGFSRISYYLFISWYFLRLQSETWISFNSIEGIPEVVIMNQQLLNAYLFKSVLKSPFPCLKDDNEGSLPGFLLSGYNELGVIFSSVVNQVYLNISN
jgi:hypothetical protein